MYSGAEVSVITINKTESALQFVFFYLAFGYVIAEVFDIQTSYYRG